MLWMNVWIIISIIIIGLLSVLIFWNSICGVSSYSFTDLCEMFSVRELTRLHIYYFKDLTKLFKNSFDVSKILWEDYPKHDYMTISVDIPEEM